MVDDLAGARVNDPALDGLDISIFCRAERRVERAIQVGARRGHLVRRVMHNQIRRADPPYADVLELRLRGDVSRVTLRSARVHPLDDRRDLSVAQRRIVLVLLDADRLVDEPRWHLALGDALFRRPRPWPRV